MWVDSVTEKLQSLRSQKYKATVHPGALNAMWKFSSVFSVRE